jgi:hypothetical protein
MGPYDVVIPLGSSSNDYFELRYSLRSMCQHFPHRGLFIVGKQPKWLCNAVHIPYMDGVLKNQNIANKVLQACMTSKLSDDFLFRADDIFFTAPLPDPIPDYYFGTIREAERNPRYGNAYKQVIQNTPDGLYYDIHTPVLMNKHKFIELMQQPWGKDHLLKSTYLNRYPRNPVAWQDVKGEDFRSPVFSTNERVTRSFMKIIAELYPEPSIYEADHKTLT